MADEAPRLIEIRGGLIAGPGAVDPEETTLWEQVAPRPIDPDDWTRFEGYAAEILGAFGMELGTPGTERTPERFLKALYDATAGYEGDAKLVTTFPNEHICDADSQLAQIVEGPISFYALCEHHVLPFHGFAHVGYIPHDEIIGISKITRIVRMFARRFTVQERLSAQVADALADLMDPHGVAVHVEAVHLCTQMRGVREEHSKTATTMWRRGYTENPELRRDFLTEVARRNPWA
jgi:GTP cyclohydrolase IA